MAGSISSETLPHGGGPPGGAGDFGGDSARPSGAFRRASLTGIFVLFAAIVMLFAAFTSAMVVRRGLSSDLVSLPLPGILWWNTGVLILSSAALELGRRALRSRHRENFNRYWSAGSVLGVVFLAGQVLAWRQLQAAGIYLDTNPSSSFFYLLTVAHALHLGGGLLALFYIDVQALRLRLGPGRRTAVEVSSIYWHFMDGLWIYLMLLFLIWG